MRLFGSTNNFVPNKAAFFFNASTCGVETCRMFFYLLESMREIHFDQIALKHDANPLESISIVPNKDGIFFFVCEEQVAKIGRLGTIVYEGNVLIASENRNAPFTAILMDICSRVYGKPVRMKNVCEPPESPCTALDYAKHIHVPYLSTAFEYNNKMLFVFLDAIFIEKEPSMYYVSIYLLNNNFLSFLLPGLCTKCTLTPDIALKFAAQTALMTINEKNFSGEYENMLMINKHFKSVYEKFTSAGVNPKEIFDYLSTRHF